MRDTTLAPRRQNVQAGRFEDDDCRLFAAAVYGREGGGPCGRAKVKGQHMLSVLPTLWQKLNLLSGSQYDCNKICILLGSQDQWIYEKNCPPQLKEIYLSTSQILLIITLMARSW